MEILWGLCPCINLHMPGGEAGDKEDPERLEQATARAREQGTGPRGAGVAAAGPRIGLKCSQDQVGTPGTQLPNWSQLPAPRQVSVPPLSPSPICLPSISRHWHRSKSARHSYSCDFTHWIQWDVKLFLCVNVGRIRQRLGCHLCLLGITPMFIFFAHNQGSPSGFFFLCAPFLVTLYVSVHLFC